MADSEMRATLVREKLVVDSDATFAETVDKARNLLRLDDRGGLHPNPELLRRMGSRQKVELYILGRYLGHAGKLTDSDSATDEQIARFFGMKVLDVQKRIHDLKHDGRIELVEKGTYRLTEGRVGEVLRDLGADV